MEQAVVTQEPPIKETLRQMLGQDPIRSFDVNRLKMDPESSKLLGELLRQHGSQALVVTRKDEVHATELEMVARRKESVSGKIALHYLETDLVHVPRRLKAALDDIDDPFLTETDRFRIMRFFGYLYSVAVGDERFSRKVQYRLEREWFELSRTVFESFFTHRRYRTCKRIMMEHNLLEVLTVNGHELYRKDLQLVQTEAGMVARRPMCKQYRLGPALKKPFNFFRGPGKRSQRGSGWVLVSIEREIRKRRRQIRKTHRQITSRIASYQMDDAQFLKIDNAEFQRILQAATPERKARLLQAKEGLRSFYANHGKRSERLFTNITSMPRELRSALRHDGYPMAEIDIRVCHLYLLFHFYDECTGEEAQKYLDWLSNRDFYTELCPDKPREETKVAVMKFLNCLGRRPCTNFAARAFEQHFPALCAVLREEFELGKYRTLALTLQNLEARLILPIVEDLCSYRFGVFTIHDALLVPIDNLEFVLNLFQQQLNKNIGFPVRLRVTRFG
jgi:hypothetical protein